jgi:hypothetical protein
MKIIDDNKEDVHYPRIADIEPGTIVRYMGKPHMVSWMEDDHEPILVDLKDGEAFHVEEGDKARILEDAVLTINGSKQKAKK